ncbi:hypothetical protein BpHYR1_035953 [Brachionus plicatilis]|uniref:Uncharacterized protein n=1 Tax=Brachionus plicatilis TaxID=10195 RepID=A0A3M7S8L8_BRAPC|nr:hypothetical protein BpHYR1_035953 [Brachionus plicatilis]
MHLELKIRLTLNRITRKAAGVGSHRPANYEQQNNRILNTMKNYAVESKFTANLVGSFCTSSGDTENNDTIFN